MDAPDNPYVPPQSSAVPAYKVVVDSSSTLVEEIIFTNVTNYTIAPWLMNEDEDEEFTPPEPDETDMP